MLTIVGISIARKNPRGRGVVLDSIREYMPGINEDEIQEKTVFLDQYIGDGYGKESNEIAETIKKSMIRYGIPMDSTYTGKAFLGMKKYIKENGIEDKKTYSFTLVALRYSLMILGKCWFKGKLDL